MIKNIVFDFGNVLVHYDPKKMAQSYADTPADALLLEKVVFDRLYWDDLDMGTIDERNAIPLVCQRLPERLHEAAEKLLLNWIYMLPEFDGIAALVEKLKTKYNMPLFLLSNISTYFAEHSSEIPVLKNFDKCIFSGVCGCVKPDPKIFDILCKECRIDPQESIFIDDSEKNLAGARDFGLQTYLFDGDVEKLEKALLKLIENK